MNVQMTDMKLPKDPLAMTDEMFECLLECIITNAQYAFQSAKQLDVLKCSSREIYMQMILNQFIEKQIIELGMISGVFITFTQTTIINQVPFPPRLNREMTLRNWHNKLGWRDAQKSDLTEVK